MRMNQIDPTASVHPEAILGDGCVIGRNVVIGRSVTLGNNVEIEDNCVIGYDRLTRIHDEAMLSDRLYIGDNSLVRTGAILYTRSSFGRNVKIGHTVVLREGMRIGDNSIIGCLVKCEGYTSVGARSVIHAQTHMTAFMTIEDYVFFGPGCTTMNDPAAAHYRDIQRDVRGPLVRRGCRIGGNVTLTPGIEIGEEAFIGAGAVVSRNVPAREFWAGVPARKLRDVSEAELLSPVD